MSSNPYLDDKKQNDVWSYNLSSDRRDNWLNSVNNSNEHKSEEAHLNKAEIKIKEVNTDSINLLNNKREREAGSSDAWSSFANKSNDREYSRRDSGGDRTSHDRRRKSCYNCNKDDHYTNHCPEPRSNRPNRRFNHRNEEDYSTRDSVRDELPKKCLICSQEGHRSRECSKPMINLNDYFKIPRGCFNCKAEDHSSRYCPNKQRGFEDKERTLSCFNCKQVGHFTRECTEPKPERKRCFNCGDEAHMSKDCPQPRKERTTGCYNCGDEAHISRDCPQFNKGTASDVFNTESNENWSSKSNQQNDELSSKNLASI